MKVKTLTIHYGVNYGSVLQTYALSKVITDLGNDVEVINYIPRKYNLWREFSADKMDRYPKCVVLLAFVLKAPEKMYRRRLFSSFLNENVQLTRVYTSTETLRNSPPTADLFVVGSDQVWNFDYNEDFDYTYFFDFISDRSNCISYAASIGKDNLSNEEKKVMKHFLKDFRSVSVREDECVNQLKKINIVSEHVLDPTLLLDSDEWNRLVKNGLEKKDKYVLVYVMDFLYEDLINIAEKVKRCLGYKIYVISFSKIYDARVDCQFIYASPNDFLKLINNADYVVTNSFHGVAFSINYNKQFIAVGKAKYNIRIHSLLRMLNLEDRFIAAGSLSKDEIINKEIDYDAVNNIVAKWRAKSMLFLKVNLKKVKR